MVSFTNFHPDQSTTFLHSTYPHTLGMATSERTNSPPTLRQEIQKQESLLLPDGTISHRQDNLLQNFHPLPPYATLQGNLHHRALIRAASLYAYDFSGSANLPLYFP